MAVVLPSGPPYTIDDLDRFPDDGNRYELIEGSLHVTPSPAIPHQQVVANVFALLREACTADHNVLFAPLDVILGPATVLQPDVLVLPWDAEQGRRVIDTPDLVVEVLSPSTRAYDRGTKWRVYREAGIASFWIVDPDAPSVTVWDWAADDEVGTLVSGDDRLEVTRPYPVTIVPADLVAWGGRR